MLMLLASLSATVMACAPLGRCSQNTVQQHWRYLITVTERAIYVFFNSCDSLLFPLHFPLDTSSVELFNIVATFIVVTTVLLGCFVVPGSVSCI